jgi:hypothetical protein
MALAYYVFTHPDQETTIMRRLSPTLKTLLEGLAYADLAEMLPPSAKNRSLGPDHGTADSSSASVNEVPAMDSGVLPSPRRVGLFLGPYATNALIDYAFDSCVRLDAELVVFTFMDGTRARRLLEESRSWPPERPPVLHIEHLTGKPEQALRSLQGRGSRLEFLVCDERGYLGHQIVGREISLDVPVVMVAPPQERVHQRVSRPPAGAMPAKQ